MNRVHCDNALLASCERMHDSVIALCLKAVVVGMGIGVVWYVAVSVRAGAF